MQCGIMIKVRLYGALTLALAALILPLNTQAENMAGAPAEKPLAGGIPLPATKPDMGGFERFIKASVKNPDMMDGVDYSADLDPISKQQADIYQRIFAFQSLAQIDKADQEMRNLKDERLLGHVLFQRYMHPTAYKTSFEELKYWLDLYADHPGASRIYKMALARKPADFGGTLKKPEEFKGIAIVQEPTVERAKKYKPSKSRTKHDLIAIRALERDIEKNIRAGSMSHALKVIRTNAHSHTLDGVEQDILRSRVAAGYFYNGHMDKALDVASAIAGRSGEKAPMAAWIAGLIEWKNKNYESAARYFAISANSPYSSGWTSGASAFWAARAHMRAGNVKEVSTWLNKAHEHPRTFYGLLAARALGKDFNFDWKIPTFTREYFNILNATPQGQRAMALVAAGQNHLAEAELTRIDPDSNEDLYTALLAYADFAGLPALAYRVGGLLSDRNQQNFYDMALYPVTPWEPSNGYEIDPAMINAIMRQESRFNPYAVSPSGASGLMQLMPATASYISEHDFSGKGKYKLLNPQMNLDIGQNYLKRLIGNNLVKGDIIKLLVAYNAGPGNLQKWASVIDAESDPLLFIEMIPVAETRAYVERVLSSYWIYRLRDGKQTATLDLLAQGQWPTYQDMKNAEEFQIALSR